MSDPVEVVEKPPFGVKIVEKILVTFFQCLTDPKKRPPKLVWYLGSWLILALVLSFVVIFFPLIVCALCVGWPIFLFLMEIYAKKTGKYVKSKLGLSDDNKETD